MAKGLYIGVDMGGPHIRAALADGEGRIVRRIKTKTAIEQEAEKATARLIDACRKLAGDADGEMRGAGLGMAGKIDSRSGRVLFSPNLPKMVDFPLGAEVQKALGRPVVIDNDANALAVVIIMAATKSPVKMSFATSLCALTPSSSTAPCRAGIKPTPDQMKPLL